MEKSLKIPETIIRNWQGIVDILVASYLEKVYPEAALSHACCPECTRKLYPGLNPTK